jgi:hypothetical protein
MVLDAFSLSEFDAVNPFRLGQSLNREISSRMIDCP